jgi:hypothetical protein
LGVVAGEVVTRTSAGSSVVVIAPTGLAAVVGAGAGGSDVTVAAAGGATGAADVSVGMRLAPPKLGAGVSADAGGVPGFFDTPVVGAVGIPFVALAPDGDFVAIPPAISSFASASRHSNTSPPR